MDKEAITHMLVPYISKFMVNFNYPAWPLYDKQLV